MENLFVKVVEEGYYKTVKTESAFNGNYIQIRISWHNQTIFQRHDKVPIKSNVPSGEIINVDTFGEWKIQLKIHLNNFISSKDSGEIRTMDSKSNNIEIIMGSETDDIINELFESFLQRYQKKLEEEVKGIDFIFEGVDLLYYGLHKTRLRKSGSCIKSPEWLINKRATINPKNKKDNNCF